MSGFDVHIVDARRSRTLVFFGVLTVVLLTIAALLISRTSPSPQAPIALSDAETSEVVQLEAVPADHLIETPQTSAGGPMELSNPVGLPDAEHIAFADWRGQSERIETRVRRGQTFASVLDAAGADRVDAARAIAALEPYFSSRELRAGQNLTIFMEEVADGRQLAGLSFRPDSDRTLTVARSGDQFSGHEAIASLEREIVRATGEVNSSLYLSAIERGATDRIVVELANILGFAVDFRGIQPGDDFDIVFERFTNRRGETVRTGDILYIVFDGRGDPLEYFRFETPDGEVGYYTTQGESARRLLMLMPINGARISSSFGMRFHPILNSSRPHNGTDFAAPRGTPIMAAGAGIVERSNRFGTFGNYIRIRHSNGYQTAYAHLQGFARGIRAGARVQQGQTIGYVGTTGRSTGPHLHYEVHLNGRPTNPMALDLPTGKTLTEDELALFEAERTRLQEIRDAARPARVEASAPQATPAAMATQQIQSQGEARR